MPTTGIPVVPVPVVSISSLSTAYIWTALAFIGGDYLCRQTCPVGVIAATIDKILQGMTQFPGVVAFALCFLLIPVEGGAKTVEGGRTIDDCWTRDIMGRVPSESNKMNQIVYSIYSPLYSSLVWMMSITWSGPN
jgi:hypothetical protein